MKKKTQKIIICISLVIMLFVSFGNVFGATNESYSTNTKVYENALDSKISSSLLLDLLANMINALASLVESLVGGIFSVLTGDNIFPWADRIIFNAIPFLDINFLNPDPSSLFGSVSSPSILGKVVQQVYSTIFSLAVLFLGVAVGVMAIRLAISSIAAEKAKYKQAIVNWATCIVMLFLMHYILAFVFWINEQMVEIASNILLTTIKKEKIDSVNLKEALDSLLSAEDRVNLFIKASWGAPEADVTTLKENAEITSNLITSPYTGGTDGRIFDRNLENDSSGNWNIGKFWADIDDRMGAISIPVLAHDVRDAKNISEMDPDVFSESYKNGEIKFKNAWGFTRYLYPNTPKGKEAFKKNEYEYKKILSTYAYLYYVDGVDGNDKDLMEDKVKTMMNKEELQNIIGPWDSERGNFIFSRFDNKKQEYGNSLQLVKDNRYNIFTLSELEWALGPELVNMATNYRLQVDGWIIDAAGYESAVSGSATDIIANLGAFFKQAAYVYTTEEVSSEDGKEVITGWRASKLSVTGALLYGIFIFQSCIYLIMYVKRLFYVIMLAMFGPIVVIYDFFIKSAS